MFRGLHPYMYDPSAPLRTEVEVAAVTPRYAVRPVDAHTRTNYALDSRHSDLELVPASRLQEGYDPSPDSESGDSFCASTDHSRQRLTPATWSRAEML
jgi:hypothetical protein